jgi:hypothetical protein
MHTILGKFLLINLVSTHLLINTCSAMNFVDDSFTLSIATLKIGYELSMKGQPLILENGTEWEVSNAVLSASPVFLDDDMFDNLDGNYDKSKDAFYFILTDFVGYNRKLNPKTRQYENDLANPLPGIERFKLLVKHKKQ